MFTKQSLLQNQGEPASNLEAAFNGEGGDKGQTAETMDPKRMFNELQKLNRLNQKNAKENAELRQQLGSILPAFEGMKNMFSAPSQREGEKPLTYAEKVRTKHNALIENDPNSGGLSLTLEAAEIIEKLQSENMKLQKQMENASMPQRAAEGVLFVNIEGGIKDKLFELFNDDARVEENYPDYERVATQRLKEVYKNKAEWLRLLRSPALQEQFAKTIIESKMPRLENVPGWKKLDTYSFEDAQKDMLRSEQLAREGKRGEATRLAEKARPVLLNEMFQGSLKG